MWKRKIKVEVFFESACNFLQCGFFDVDYNDFDVLFFLKKFGDFLSTDIFCVFNQ